MQAIQELSMARDISTVMKIVRTVARKLAGSDGATFVLRDGDLSFYADEDAISPLWKGSRFPMETCISGWSIMNRQAVAIEDIYTDDRIPVDAYRPTFVKSLVMVPIRKLDPMGAIGNYWSKKYLASQEDIALLQSLADITAVTLENINMYNEMEQRVKDRTVKLEAANKDLEAFSYSVSHDLRAPLRAIHGYMNILKEEYADKFDDEGKRYVNRVISNVRDMGQLVDDLLTFFRMGRQDVIRTKVSMKSMVETIWSDCVELEKERMFELRLGDLPEARADSTLIKQVWSNLIANAVKFTRNKEKAIVEIGFEENKDEVIYTIKDNGAGFDMRYYDKLFGIFQRMHSHVEFEGTGIGLSIVERVVNMHGGRVWAKAEVNKGAEFLFSIPKTWLISGENGAKQV